MQYDHKHHAKLVAELSMAQKKSFKFFATEIKEDTVLVPKDFNEMKTAFENERKVLDKLREYLSKFSGPDGKIKID
ncbi:MAG: hypothetical protein KAR42_10735 [candidate division Zixibacteria bacterium]|nr:hypothetical protein [candidate division Zixibacteria bacterium]